MGRHIAVNRKRGVAGWPLLVMAVIVVLVAGTVGYFAILRKDNSVAGGSCSGNVALPLLASSGASPAARALSEAFNASSPVSRSTCLRSTVVSMPSADAARALIAHWKGRTDPAPGIWLTDDAEGLLEVDAQASDLTAGRDASPLAISPVVLAMRPADAQKAGPLTWRNLSSELGPRGTVRDAAGRPIPLLLSDPRISRATGYAAESMVTAANESVTVAQLKAGAAQLKALRGAADYQPTTGDGLDLLSKQLAPGAVPVTEAELAVFNAGSDSSLAAVYPSGPVAGDQLFAVALSADWLTPTLRDAATKFTAFTRSPAGIAVLAAAHFRVPGASTSAANGSDGPAVTSLPAAQAHVGEAIAIALGYTPSSGAGASSASASGAGASSAGLSSAGLSSAGPSRVSSGSAPVGSVAPAMTPRRRVRYPALRSLSRLLPERQRGRRREPQQGRPLRHRPARQEPPRRRRPRAAPLPLPPASR